MGAPLRFHLEKLRAMREPDCLGKGQRHKGATFVSPSGLSLGVAGEVNLNTLRQQAFTPALTTTGQDGAAAFGLHPSAEAELLFTCPLGRLICAFGVHKPENSIGKRAETLPGPPLMSTGSST